MKLADFLEVETIFPTLKANTKQDVIKELADNISNVHPNINNERLTEALLDREKLCSTALDSGVAVPHAKISGITEIILGFGRSLEGIVFESLDKKPTNFFITLITPEDVTGIRIQLLARISKVFRNQDLRSRLMNCDSEQAIFQTIKLEDEKY
ncbi:MAG: PTS sugar transporter subunit IIA [Candidatus Dadabacteria bacterium]|jgi:PTS system nitrogen regulatory IIA component|nr:MAG: PTS sugar transporter subunit IIA [Thermodesulfobacteriales bacterium]